MCGKACSMTESQRKKQKKKQCCRKVYFGRHSITHHNEEKVRHKTNFVLFFQQERTTYNTSIRVVLTRSSGTLIKMPTSVTCNHLGTVEDSLKRSSQFRGIANNTNDREVVVVRDGKAINSHFPCSSIKDEHLTIKYINTVVTEVNTEMSNLVDNLDGATYKIILLKKSLPESLEDDYMSNVSQGFYSDENQNPSQARTTNESGNKEETKDIRIFNDG
ncbi:hypothetical protein F2P81_005985 [Scophthalmus maximus]|uniref:Uncharacterized protein n=1 Tax=Scophthalmus maximus TaxID=52904 RepID=A0A6A4T8Q9_SCOMX|nr:hypothetical protein F2P81_005985 [Scophthalmus maximus]